MRSLLLGLVLAFAAGCGGTSSETPWPAEPEGPTLGPQGELGPAASARQGESRPGGPRGGEAPAVRDAGPR